MLECNQRRTVVAECRNIQAGLIITITNMVSPSGFEPETY